MFFEQLFRDRKKHVEVFNSSKTRQVTQNFRKQRLKIDYDDYLRRKFAWKKSDIFDFLRYLLPFPWCSNKVWKKPITSFPGHHSGKETKKPGFLTFRENCPLKLRRKLSPDATKGLLDSCNLISECFKPSKVPARGEIAGKLDFSTFINKIFP